MTGTGGRARYLWLGGLLALDPAQGADPTGLRAHVMALVAALRAKASLVMSHEWQSQATRLDSLRHLHVLALMSVLGAAVAGMGLVAILIDRERRLMNGRLDVDFHRELTRLAS